MMNSLRMVSPRKIRQRLQPTPRTGRRTGATPSGAPAIAAASPPPGKAQSRKTPSGKNGKVQIGRVQSAPAAATAAQERETPAPAEPVENPPADDTSVVKGGLY